MTNKHCDACGSPVFRHDGQEFCPECHDGGADTAAEDDAEGVDADGPSGGGARSSEPADRQPGTGVASPDENSRSPGDGESRSDGREGPLRAAPDREQTDADLGEARASLVRTLATMARRAEATDDPRRAKELLGAAREAAEAIAALDS